MNIRVLTLNVWGLPLGIARHHAQRMEAIGEQFGPLGADVIALQEVWTPEARSQLTEAGKAHGYTTLWHRKAAFGGSGLMLLSRWPVEDIRFTPFRLAGLPQRPQHADYYGGKGFAEFTLRTSAGLVSIINTHLHAGYTPAPELDEYDGLRAAQAIQIATAIRKIKNPVIALGDFNTEEHEPASRILLGLSGLLDSAQELDLRQATIVQGNPYRGADAPDARIDLILSRGGEETEIRPTTLRRVLDAEFRVGSDRATYSDHAGLFGVFELSKRAKPVPVPDPVSVETLNLAHHQIELGRKISLDRQSRESVMAAGGLILGLTAGAGAFEARRRRRQWLFGFATSLAGLSTVGASGAYWGSRSVVAHELQVYDQIIQALNRMKPALPERDKLRTK